MLHIGYLRFNASNYASCSCFFFRNQGIGSAVLQEAIAWSRDQDLELLIVWPSEEAKPHYERAGFTVENEIMERSLREYYSPNWASEPTPRR